MEELGEAVREVHPGLAVQAAVAQPILNKARAAAARITVVSAVFPVVQQRAVSII
jgi:hypothetical protein